MERDSKVVEISKQFKLPEWWVESVIIEYLPCRRYGESGKLHVFDFDMLTDEDIQKIPKQRVIVSRVTLLQNIRPDDFGMRALLVLTDLPYTPLQNSNSIPEGPANSTYFTLQANPIDIVDPKLGFWEQAIVYDDGVPYQWTIAETYKADSKHQWYKSDLFDLSRLYSINMDLRDCAHQDLLKHPTPEHIQLIKDKYEELEKERAVVRDKIWQEHLNRKQSVKINGRNVSNAPPMLSYFDTVELKDGKYYTKTYMAPLLLRSAIRNLNRANKANEKIQEGKNNHDALLDEMEYSAMCIISSVNCLEAYINDVIVEYLDEDFGKIGDSLRIKDKWWLVPHALDLKQKFASSTPPFSNFLNLVSWRNRIIHPTAKFSTAQGSRSNVSYQINVENAKMAVKTIKEMIEALSDGGNIPLPDWIQAKKARSEYWNEVSDYLKKV